MYAMTWLLDWTHLFGATRSREVIDEFARWTADELDYLVEARQAVLLYEHAQGRQDRADRPRLPRLHDVARPDHGAASTGIPLIEIMIAKRDGDTDVPRRRSRPRGHDLDRIVRQPRLEHAQPGLRVRLLPRGPAPGQPVRAAGRRHRLRRLRDRRPAARRRPGLADALQLAALPGRGGGGRPRAHALARADRRDRRRRRPAGSSSGVHQAFLYDTVADRPRTTDGGARARRARTTENPYSKLAVDILETIRVQQLTHVAEHRRLPQDAGHARDASSLSWPSSTTCRRTSGASSAASPASRGSRCSTRAGRSTGCTRGPGGCSARSSFLEFLEAQEPVITEATSIAVRVPEPDPAGQAAVDRLRDGRPGRRVPCCTWSSSSPMTPVRLLPREVDYTWFQLGLLAVLAGPDLQPRPEHAQHGSRGVGGLVRPAHRRGSG